MANNQFINLEELSKTTQALLSKINEQSNLKVNKANVKSELNEGIKIGSVEGIEFYTPEVNTSNFVVYDDLANVAYSGSYNNLTDTPTLAAVATSGSYNSLTDKPDTSIFMIKGTDYVTAGQLKNSTLGNKATAEGYFNTASGAESHAEGYHNTASGTCSHAEGCYTIAQRLIQHVFGQYNIADTAGAGLNFPGNYIEIVGNGGNENTRSNARTLDWSGNEWLAGKLTVGTAPTANMDVTTKQYVDNGDSALSTRISTLENAGYQNSTQVNSAIATAIGNINQFEVTIVTDLPTTNIDTHTIYFKSNSSSGNNVYDEYMYINSNWELIGSTQIDLTPYARSANLAAVATSGDYDDLTDAPVAETDANVETMLDSFNLDYTSNTLSPNMWQGGSY